MHPGDTVGYARSPLETGEEGRLSNTAPTYDTQARKVHVAFDLL